MDNSVSSVKQYRKKPVVVEALQWTGTNRDELTEFVGRGLFYNGENNLCISTLEGDMRADIGDFIIKGVRGEFYPCKPDVFEKTYELV